MTELTGNQRSILSALHNHRQEAPPTPREIAEYLWGDHPNYKPYNYPRSVGATLRKLAKRGLCRRLGWSQNGGRCWEITPKGQAALTEARS
jgi:DNA-binding PadR family transcriptional regulator